MGRGLLTLLFSVSVGCGGNDGPAPAVAPPPQVPAEEPVVAAAREERPPEPPPPVTPAPTAPCVVFEHGLRNPAGIAAVTEVPLATGAWQAGSAPAVLTPDEARAAGGIEEDFGGIIVRAGEGAPELLYVWDGGGRVATVTVSADQARHYYVYQYDCRGIPVRYPGRMMAPCRAEADGGSVTVHCWPDTGSPHVEYRCRGEIARGELTDAAGEESLLGCYGEYDDECVQAAVIVSSGVPVFAVHAGVDMACIGATVRAGRGRAPAELRIRGRGEDEAFDVTYRWEGGRMEVLRERYGAGYH